jgi:hypothetical protein
MLHARYKSIRFNFMNTVVVEYGVPVSIFDGIQLKFLHILRSEERYILFLKPHLKAIKYAKNVWEQSC